MYGSGGYKPDLENELFWNLKTKWFASNHLWCTSNIHSSSYISGGQGDRTAKQRVAASDGGTPIVYQKDGGGDTTCFRVFKNPVATLCDLGLLQGQTGPVFRRARETICHRHASSDGKRSEETLLKVRRILRVVEKTCFDPWEAIENTLLMFLTWISVFAVKLISAISALRWIFPTLIRVAFTFSSTKREQFPTLLALCQESHSFLGRHSEVTEIVSVSWLKILGRIKTGMLSPDTLYEAYLVFKESSDGAYGFKNMPFEVTIGVIGEVTDSRIMNLVVGSSESNIRRRVTMVDVWLIR
ncbi:putative F-box protein PP2-B12 [Glycine soja]